MKQSIRNFRSTKSSPPRVCDVIVEGDTVDLVFKTGKNNYERMPLEDLLYQINIAKGKSTDN